MKVAILHYWFISRRGGEKVVESILKIFPEADIYTLFYDKVQYGDHLKGHKVYTSILNIPLLRKNHQKVFPLYPIGVRSLKLKQNYDLIISSESGPIKGVKIPKGTPHICYIHSPMRYCWGFTEEYLRTIAKPIRPVVNYFFKRLREWDKTTVNNVDLYISNSYNVSNRVKAYYNRNSIVVYPPIENSLFTKEITRNTKEIYLSFGALVPYKRIDLLVDTFNENKKSLIIVGEGSERKRLQKKAKSNILFTGKLSWAELEKLFAKSQALLFPGIEDFGMIPLEVMAYGVPIIAYKEGGAIETVIENTDNIKESTGLFFTEQNSESINAAIKKFEKIWHLFDPKWIRNHAKKFSEDKFIFKLKKELEPFMKSR